MRLSDYLGRDYVAVLDAANKREAIDAVLAILARHPAIVDAAALADAIWQREEALSTGIGLGIGVPHVRSDCTREEVAALATLRRGVDYGSMDGVPVRLILMIAMPEGKHKEYLQYLATACRLFQNQEFSERLFAAQDADELWQ
ncbi:MAG: PTS sugar transporter subunit IIA, partial [Planctomycetota bacterium]|nr:PTS sugar transporter subunit IIA [Planctomycetota bacterium]